jgi:hypothetical protein
MTTDLKSAGGGGGGGFILNKLIKTEKSIKVWA